MSVRRLIGLATLAAALVLAAPAHAQFEITEFSVAPASPAAGAHSDVTIVTGFPAGAGQPHPRNLTIHLPPGLVGNPRAADVCTSAQFDATSCPASSQVGTTSVVAVVAILPLPLTIPGEVYNLEPAGGAPARLGIVVRPPLLPPIRIPVAVTVRPSDAGLDSAVVDLPTSTALGETWIQQMTLTLRGSGPEFMTNPTSCIPATASVDAVSYDGVAAHREAAPFTPTGCGSVPFDPTVAAALETSRRAAPSGYTVTLGLPEGHSHVKRAEVVLPEGTTISSGVANGLEACTEEQFGPPEAPSGCPAASRIGSVSFTTPLLGTLGGEVFFGAPRPDGSMPLFVAVDQSGVRLKLVGTVTLDRGNGRITTVFDNLPQTPFTSFSLSFKGGSRAVLANPQGCGTYPVSARLTPWSAAPGFPAEADRAPTNTFAIDADCADPQPFRPSMAIRASNTQAAAPAGAVALTVSRPDGDRNIDRMTIDMPPGLVGKVTAAELCPEAGAATGNCPAGSRVGRADVRVGAGPEPVSLSGAVYLTGPTGTAPLGMSIALAAKVGPLDLGTVVTRAGIVLRPTDGGLTVSTTSLPRFLQGIPVDIRELTLTLDRQGFMLNASGCDRRAVRGRFVAAGGGEATAEAPYQATGCDRVPYAPRISGTIGAKGLTGNGQKPPLSTVVTNPAGHAANKTVAVTLPPEVGIDLKRVNQLTCRTAQLQAGTCPPLSRVGKVTAQTSLLPFPLTGPVILSERGPGQLPGLTVQLEGPVSLRLDGAAALTPQGIRTTFLGVPDVPLDRLELALKGGRDGALILGRDLCSITPLIRGEFEGQNGKRVTHSEEMNREGCNPPRVSIKLRGLRGSKPALQLTVKRRNSKAPKIQRVSLRLPRTLRAHPRAKSGLVGRRDKRKLTRSRIRLSRNGTLTLRVPGQGASTVRATLRKGAFTASRSLKRQLRRRPRLSFRVDVVNRDGTRSRITVRVRAPRR